MWKKQRKTNTNRQSATVGLVPEMPVFIGEQKREHIRIDIIDYNEATFNEFPRADLSQCSHLAKLETITWINVSGIHDLAVIESIGKTFGLHPLTIEDIVNTSQRPKAEIFPGYLFIALKMISYNSAGQSVDIEHVSLIVGEKYIISFLEDEGDVFDSVRESIRSSKGRIRSMKSDFLAYALMDAVVDNYFLAVERIGDIVEELDDRILSDPKPGDIQDVHQIKRNILHLRKAVWPLREEVSTLEKSESSVKEIFYIQSIVPVYLKSSLLCIVR